MSICVFCYGLHDLSCHLTSQQCSHCLLATTNPQFEGVAGEEHANKNIKQDIESSSGEG
jgi:hypothetical protein